MSPEVLTLAEATEDWWAGYQAALHEGGLTSTARQVVELDAEFITKAGVLGAGVPGQGGWPKNRVRKGLVVGSVQSGKTASMLAVVAKSLDRGVDAVILLTGTRVALWRQTAQRVLEQLDRWTPEADGQRTQRRVLIPKPNYLLGRGKPPALADLYVENPQAVARAMIQGRPLIAIAMKNADHLTRLREAVKACLDRRIRRDNRPVYMLVIDDEADDGSILDAVVESSLGPESEALKKLPRHIRRLWSGPGDHHETWSPSLYATYIAYTATPQANLLQAEHNPLTPTDFVFSLRTPAAEGSVSPPRSPEFEESAGIAKYYTGGELFYRTNLTPSGPLTSSLALPEREEGEADDEYADRMSKAQVEALGDALRAYFVAAALRLQQSGKSLQDALTIDGVDVSKLKELSPPPMSMLIHPSASMDGQFTVSEIVASWCSNVSLGHFAPGEFSRDGEGRAVVDPAALEERLVREECRWRNWHESYFKTWEVIAEKYPGFSVPTPAAWEDVKRTLRGEIFPYVKLRVINSSPDADDRPVFRPSKCENGVQVAADLLSIFVSGNVMSRGVTIDGLLTTLFLRDSSQPRADTQMQMQRWFGYRGSHLHLCRVFLHEDQLALFEAYHENDQALRGEILGKMNGGEPAGGLTVLQGIDYLASGKIANLQALPLCPGAFPFITLTGSNTDRKANASKLAELFGKRRHHHVDVGGTLRGLLLDELVSVEEVATLLESLEFETHRPNPNHPTHRRWASIARSARIDESLFRPPNPGEAEGLVGPRSCPYSIAAYLRLWEKAITHPPRSLVPTDSSTPWHLIDSRTHLKGLPDFSVGVRFGSAGDSVHGELSSLGIQRMKRQVNSDKGLLLSTWGSRNPGEGDARYYGDQFFDYHSRALIPPKPNADGSVWRPRGAPGLLLFHVVQDGAWDIVTAGVAIPLGGPDHFAALAPGSV